MDGKKNAEVWLHPSKLTIKQMKEKLEEEGYRMKNAKRADVECQHLEEYNKQREAKTRKYL